MNLQLFFSLGKTVVVLLLIIALANISLKLGNKYVTRRKKIIRVIERVSVSNNSSLNIVEICGSYYLMSFTGNDNKILKDLDREKVQEMIAEMKKEQEQVPSIRMENLAVIKGKIENRFGMRKKS